MMMWRAGRCLVMYHLDGNCRRYRRIDVCWPKRFSITSTKEGGIVKITCQSISRSALFVLLVVIAICYCCSAALGEQNTTPGGKSEGENWSGRVVTIDLQRVRAAIQIHRRNIPNLMNLSGVVATSTGVGPDGSPVIKVFTSRSNITKIPSMVGDLQVMVKTTGRFRAYAASDRFPRPVPIGVSVGHPDISAGTIGARVTDGANVFALSNNHVFANSNNASIGDDILQPGPHDGGTYPNDIIGMLYAFKEIEYCNVYWGGRYISCPQINTIDAAIAEVMDPGTNEPMVDLNTPSDGYGAPGTTLHPAYGIPDIIDDADEDLSRLIGQRVQKYGRTTELTQGTVDSINATVDVCYDDNCNLIARFEDQIIITPGSFSDGGDSGSLIVTNDADRNPVGLLYAGSDTNTIANRIDRVLIEFGVQIDSSSQEPGPEPEPTCVTADNRDHRDAARAYGCGSYWSGSYTQACAVGSGDNLGYAMSWYSQTSSIQETSPDYWEQVSSCP